jgi:hypothetical protein
MLYVNISTPCGWARHHLKVAQRSTQAARQVTAQHSTTQSNNEQLQGRCLTWVAICTCTVAELGTIVDPVDKRSIQAALPAQTTAQMLQHTTNACNPDAENFQRDSIAGGAQLPKSATDSM